MKPEERLFIGLLRSCFQGTVPEAPEGQPDWEALHEIALSQSLSGICYVQLKKLAETGFDVPEQVLEQFQQDFHSEVYYAVNRQAAVSELTAAFERENIPFRTFKGWRTKDLWPQPLLRTMGDVDILVHTEDRRRSDDTMLSLGYQKYVDNHSVWTYEARDITVEIHDHMFYEHLANSFDYISFFDNAWDYADGPLDESFQVLYLLCHNAKHILNNGIGFRAFLDLAFYSRKGNVRWDWVCSKLNEIQLFGFAETSFALCKAWFDLEPPFPIGGIDADFYEKTTEKAFRDGTFGLENAENRSAVTAKDIMHDRSSYLFSSLRLLVKRIFPHYEDMQLAPRYAFVDGRPWLLPFAWGYRWVFCLLHKKEKSLFMLMEPIQNRKKIQERQNLIMSWNLGDEPSSEGGINR